MNTLRGRGVVGHPEADSVVLGDDQVLAIGTGLNTGELIEVEGYISAPRHDHHFHPFGYAAAVSQLNLHRAVDFASLADLLASVKGEAVVGGRLDDERLAEKRLPNRSELDAMTGSVPTLLYRYCGHLAVANSAALSLAGRSEHPDGILKEDEIAPVAALVAALQPPLSDQVVVDALNGLTALGLGSITAIVSAGDPLWCEVPDELGTLLRIAPQIDLDLGVLVITLDLDELRRAAEQIGASGGNVRFAGWKTFADGALGGRTAALYEDFDDDPGNRGILRLQPDRDLSLALGTLELGGLVAIHAIGDQANDAVLDLYQRLADAGTPGERLRIEHASMVTPRSRQRMAALGVVASVQPSFITSEVAWLGKRLGERTSYTYALGAMSQAGIKMVGGSDSPVEDPNPWPAMAAARQGGLDPDTSYYLYGPRLEVDERADLIVVDRDPLGEDVADSRVIARWRRGRPVSLPAVLEFV